MFLYGSCKEHSSQNSVAFITPILGLFLFLRRQSLLATRLSLLYPLLGVALSSFWGWITCTHNADCGDYRSSFHRRLENILEAILKSTVAILMKIGTTIAHIWWICKGRSTLSVDQFLFGSIGDYKWAMWIMILLAVVVVRLYVIFINHYMYCHLMKIQRWQRDYPSAWWRTPSSSLFITGLWLRWWCQSQGHF